MGSQYQPIENYGVIGNLELFGGVVVPQGRPLMQRLADRFAGQGHEPGQTRESGRQGRGRHAAMASRRVWPKCPTEPRNIAS